MSAVFQMSYGALQPPTDLFGVNSALRSRAYPLSSEHRTDSDSHSPMSEPRSPLFRPSLTAEFPPHLASLYNSPYAAAAVAAAVAGQGSGAVGASPTFSLYGRAPSAAAFYPGMIAGEAWRRAPYLSQLDFCWPPGLRSLEAVVGPRTKAPREATSILKSWLNEHKDNPYPTKSEKMTLSLVTHMTLTQVSTWFANARRRIKKENKMTWTPKTRCGERDGSSSNEDESEKDYFGRQRSPFAMTRDMGSDGPVYRTSGDYDERKRQLSFDGAATSSSRPFSSDIPRKAPTHPLFAAFSGLQSPYGSLNPASLEDAFRRRLLSKQKDSTLENKGSEFPTEEKKLSDHKNIEDKRDSIRSPPALLARVFQREVNSAKTAATVTEQGVPQRTEIRMPFVHLQQNRHPSANDDDKDDHDEEKQKEIQEEPADVVTKHDVDDASGPFPVPSKSEGNASTPGQAPSYKVDKESERPKSVEEQPFLQQKQLPSLYRPFHMAGDIMAKSASNGKVDALSCWIRDFQKLVSSGQEFKAKQALAAALAVAAKAGAYSGMGGTQRPAPYFNPHRLSAEGRLSSDRSREDATRLHRRPSPPLSNRTFRFSAMDISEHENKSREDDVKTLSPEMPLRRSTSPDTPPANAVRLRSPYKGPIGARDVAPMNLSKLPPTKDWSATSASMANDDGRIEA